MGTSWKIICVLPFSPLYVYLFLINYTLSCTLNFFEFDFVRGWKLSIREFLDSLLLVWFVLFYNTSSNLEANLFCLTCHLINRVYIIAKVPWSFINCAYLFIDTCAYLDYLYVNIFSLCSIDWFLGI